MRKCCWCKHYILFRKLKYHGEYMCKSCSKKYVINKEK